MTENDSHNMKTAIPKCLLHDWVCYSDLDGKITIIFLFSLIFCSILEGNDSDTKFKAVQICGLIRRYKFNLLHWWEMCPLIDRKRSFFFLFSFFFIFCIIDERLIDTMISFSILRGHFPLSVRKENREKGEKRTWASCCDTKEEKERWRAGQCPEKNEIMNEGCKMGILFMQT